MAAGVMSVAHGKGVAVPGELSIIGFDDSPTATHIWPTLSTVRWPIRDMGVRAARTLVADFLGPQAKIAEDESPVLPSTFIERQSVAPPPSRRSEERRVGKECVSTCRSRWSPSN